MKIFSPAMLLALGATVIRGAKEALYKAVEKFTLSIDSPSFGGVYQFDNGNCAIKVYTNDEKTFSKFLAVSKEQMSQSEFVVELQVATRDAEGVYNGNAWAVKAGEFNLKVVG